MLSESWYLTRIFLNVMYLVQARLRQTVAAAVEFKPHLVVTVDTKGFSFRVLRSLVGEFFSVWRSDFCHVPV